MKVEFVEPVGRLTELSEGRVVFLGRVKGSDRYYLGFRNPDSKDIKLILSNEAMMALNNLYITETISRQDQCFPENQNKSNLEWRVIERELS